MAKKVKEDKKEQADLTIEMDSSKLSKELIRELNKGDGPKIAWNLVTDSDNPTDVKEWISTGSTLLDFCISNRIDGGIPVGKLTEINGEEASGKSLVIAHLIAETQKRGGIAILLDTENAVNPDFLNRIGVDVSKLVYVQPGTIEEVGETIEKLVIMTRAKAPGKLILIAWDSVAGTPPQAEIEGNYDPNERVGLTGKALAKMMRKLTQVWGRERIAMVFTNQLRAKFGVTYGDPMATTGGKAIPYHSSVRVRMTRSIEMKNEPLKKGEVAEPGERKDETWGIHTHAKVIKNRLGPPLRKCEFDIAFSHGIDNESSWFDFLNLHQVITKADGMAYASSFKGLPVPPCPDLKNSGHVAKGCPACEAEPIVKLNPKHEDWGHMFRAKQWVTQLAVIPGLRAWALAEIAKLMIVKYDQPVTGQELDEESLMDNEEVVAQVTGAATTELPLGS